MSELMSTAPAAPAGTGPAYDLLVIGAGVNGAGIARDAAGRGLKVALVDQGDIGGATSSASTKLLHGGLRYLEFLEFGLVRKALREREVLLSLAPHIAHPLGFVLPQTPGLRPPALMRLGLLLYDHLAPRETVPGSEAIDLRRDRAGRGLDRELTRGFRYWDGWVDDSRLVLLSALDAARRGAAVRPRTRVTAARWTGEGWAVTLDGGDRLVAAFVVNAAGPWAEVVAREILGVPDAPTLKLVQGAHIVTKRVNPTDDAYLLQQPDGRVIFVIPYERDFSLIGTTELPVDAPGAAAITVEERDYLLEAANRSLRRRLKPSHVRASFAGIRPLVDEGRKSPRATTRDWRLVEHAGVPALTVVGGKITTYRLLAEAVLDRVAAGSRAWTAGRPLPGGEVPRQRSETAQHAFDRFRRRFLKRHEGCDRSLLCRLLHVHGTDAEAMLWTAETEDLGGVTAGELDYFREQEWATTAEDVLWRRTKLGLKLDRGAQQRVEAYFA